MWPCRDPPADLLPARPQRLVDLPRRHGFARPPHRGPYQLGGGTSIVDATSWDASEGYAVTSTPSMRMVVDLSDFDKSRWVNLTGVSGHAFSANYTDQTDSQIISTLIGNYGLTAAVDATTVTLKALAQYLATDWDFLLTRAEANGLIVLVSDGTVTVRKPVADGAQPVLLVTYGIDIIELQIGRAHV